MIISRCIVPVCLCLQLWVAVYESVPGAGSQRQVGEDRGREDRDQSPNLLQIRSDTEAEASRG